MKSMMKRTAIREIRQSLGRFLAIFAIIALGVGFFSGVRSTTPVMVNTVGHFLEEKNLFDYRLISTIGWDEESVKTIRQEKEVFYAEGAYSLDVICQMPKEEKLVLKVHSLPEKINGIRLNQGRMPQNPKECVIDARFGESVKPGDRIVVSEDNETLTKERLSCQEFEVVGIADSSYYIQFERGTTTIGTGSISGFMYLMPEAFRMEKYPEIFVKFRQRYPLYSKAYEQYLQSHSDRFKTFARTCAAKDFERTKQRGREAIQARKKEIEEGKAYGEKRVEEYRSDPSAYEDAVQKLSLAYTEAVKQLTEAEQQLEEMEEPTVYVLGRETNIGYACFESDSEIVKQVAKVFPVFFILVAALVCMTTMSRMVEERRTQIGIFKALGYSSRAILKKFLFYSGSAAILGCITGYFFGILLFPKVIWICYELMYIKLPVRYVFDVKLAVISLLVSVMCSMGTTYAVCRYELSETAAGLMRPKAPKAGKRVLLEYIPFLWEKIPFLHKVSIRNIFRYKGRFFMMVVGISGCMALLLTGFGIKDSIADFARIQYEEIQVADGTVTLQKELSAGEEIPEVLSEETKEYVLRYQRAWDLLAGSKVKSIELVALEDSRTIDHYMRFHTPQGRVIAYPGLSEVIVSESIANRYGIKKGDEITLRNSDMEELRVKVADIFENHVYNYIFINRDTLEQQLGKPVVYHAAYLNFKEQADVNEAAAAISRSEEVASVTVHEHMKKRLSEMMSSLNYIVLIVIASAAGLAFIVIYNLTNINMTERSREIATIKVLGFFKKETSAYVLRENIFLTTIGILAGVVLGIALHRFVMAQIVVDMVSFRVTIFRQSFVYSVLLTFVFNLLVNLVMESKLENINMAESLKSVE